MYGAGWKKRKREEEREIERHRERVREGGGEERVGEQEFPLEIFLSAAAVGWLLRRFRGVHGRKGGGEKERRRTRERE